jgi:biopolymer transport protein ExbB
MVRVGLNKLAGMVGLVLLLTFVSGVGRADAWWDAKWQYRAKVSFDLSDKGAAIKENLTDVPVLVRLHAGNFQFANAKKDGSDLRLVSSDDKSPLKFHIEKFDPKQAIALIWVRVPQLAGGGTQDSVWLYYGNDSAPAGQESGGTYDTGQVLVYHLGEDQGAPKDATSYANHAAAFAGAHNTPSVIGNGYSFKGGEKIVVQRSPSLNFAKGLTFSAWVRIAGPQSDAHLLSWQEGGQAIVVGIDQDRPYLRVGANGQQPVTSEKKSALSPNAWHLVVATADSEKQFGTLYVDGKEVASVNLKAALPSPSGEIAIGASMTGQNAFVGDLDEVQLASVTRPATWIAAAYAGQVQDGKLTAYQQEESAKGGGENLTIRLIKVTAKSITFDGWLIIALCTCMLLMAAGVFISKFTRLQKIKKGNEVFLESFNDLHDPLELDMENEDFEHSSLFRIYKAGYDQIVHWAEKHGGGKEEVTLTPSALNIFRAALDRANSDETRKMNAWMIVLTLGISGGPFWGLLGTVWGVMNTFASLAEAGEANLSAIAPGVASALACTLFGLLVAIPALFAYSFLVLHMKNLNVETRHFIEEYALRVEGFHGEEA